MTWKQRAKAAGRGVVFCIAAPVLALGALNVFLQAISAILEAAMFFVTLPIMVLALIVWGIRAIFGF